MDFFRFANILFRFINFLQFFFWYYLSSIDLLCCKFGSIFFSHLAHSHYDLCDFYIIFLNLVDSFLSTEHFFKVFFHIDDLFVSYNISLWIGLQFTHELLLLSLNTQCIGMARRRTLVYATFYIGYAVATSTAGLKIGKKRGNY